MVGGVGAAIAPGTTVESAIGRFRIITMSSTV